MKKIIWIIVLLAIAGYFVISHLEKRAKDEAERAEQKRIEQTTKSLVQEMISRTNAIDSWEQQLSKGEKIRFGPILTLELEKLWLVNRPILFIGEIKDIATQNESYYTVLVERSLFSSLNHMFDNELQLSLSSPKQQIDAFLKQHPDLFKEDGFNNGVAVIARIKAIRTAYVSGKEGEHNKIIIGERELVDIVYTESVQF